MVEDAHLQITEGGQLAQHLEWAAKHADEIDPLRALRDQPAEQPTPPCPRRSSLRPQPSRAGPRENAN
jgi:hypothetical protein